MTTEQIEYEDLMTTLKSGRKPRDHGPYKVKVGDNNLNFIDAVIDDPKPTGRQVIEAAGFRKAEEHLVFQVLRNGELEELRLEETTDLRSGQVERFLVFSSAESFRFDIDGKRLEWGHKVISGRVLKKLAGVDPAKFAVWQVIPGKDDILVEDTDLICLADAGLEHFFTGVHQTTEGDTV
ncbi:multiubiquitin domain-containing protein [Ruegeria marina]|uniref:Multiubiquitin n=1 Tax=Ruegeria marina TaxID=639004 RepID=A0A1G6WBH1_9RHOB|nr:multiubiquitin domain-containing protein [Ruegeria marina]SDD62425.1 Multiubiquitin [Ruegeria marina]